MHDVLVPLFFFASVFGFPLARRALIQRHQLELLRAQAGGAVPVPLQASGDDAPALALRLPEPHRLYALALLCRLQDAAPPADAATAYLLRRARDEYLPDTLRAYLSLSPAARRQLEQQGQSAEQVLGEQLALISQAVTDALNRDHAAVDRLLTQGRFLHARVQGAGASPRLQEALPAR